MAKLTPIFTDPEDIRKSTDSAMMEGIASQFPIEGKRLRLELANIHVVPKDFGHKEEKKAILTSSSLTYPIKADLALIDKVTGKILDKATNFTLADTFHITQKHTMVYKGNNYITSNLLVRLPGVFVRHRNDGQLEAEFNTGVGRNFSITLDPESKIFYIEVESSRILAAALLIDVLSVPDQIIKQYIPMEIWEANKQAVQGKQDKEITKLYNRFVQKHKQNKDASLPVKIDEVRQAILRGALSKVTTPITLGVQKETMDSQVFLLAMKNIISVYRGDREEDNRDSLQFKRVQNLPDFLKMRFAKNNETVVKARMKIIFSMDRNLSPNPTIKEILPLKPFNKVFQDFIVKSTLSSTPTETNPVESLENVAKATLIAPKEGGAADERAIPIEARNIHASHLGIIDPSRTPESSSAGIDQRFTVAARRDEDGILYTEVKDNVGKRHHISVQDMMKSIIGFPGQDKAKPDDLVHAQIRGKLGECKKKEVQYWIVDPTHLYTVTTNLVPFLDSNHPGRLTMAGKAITQALSLKEREEPLVQTVDEHGVPFITRLGLSIATRSPVDGTVADVASDHITIKDAQGVKHKIDFVRNLPFNMKGFMDDHPSPFKVGDKVAKGQILADNNYTKNGNLALGKNLYAAYMPFKGYNHEDGIIISRSAASSLSSHHVYKFDYSVKQDTVMNKVQFRRYFPQAFTAEQLNILDDNGIVKKGTKLKFGDPIYAVLEKRNPTEIDKAFGRLDKILAKPFSKVVETWHNEEIGEVVDVHTESSDIKVIVRSIKPLEIGDKLTGLHGNKGIVSLILEDHEMPTSKTTGKAVDLLLNPASVTSRINLGQIIETSAAKIAQKTGKPYLIHNFEHQNNLDTLKDQMKKAGVSDTDEIIDPKSGKKYGDVFAGPQYFLKLFKTTDQNYAARNVGGYDSYLQPVKGGEEGAKGVGYMEFLGLLGSDARSNLREIATIKSEKNEHFWDRFMMGEPLPKPKSTFATKKFFDYLKGAGIHVREENNSLVAAPMADADVLKMSHGQIKNGDVISAKNGQAEKDGIFDLAKTGGLRGDKWSHYTLTEPVVNPVFEAPVKSLLGLKSEEYDGLVSGQYVAKHEGEGVYSIQNHSGRELNKIAVKPGVDLKAYGFKKKAAEEEPMTGGVAIRHMLSQIDPDKHLKARIAEYNSSRSMTKKNQLIKPIKYLKGLSDMGIKDPSTVYTMKHIPLLPPIMRPVMDKGGNKVEFGDINALYKEMILSNEALDKIKDDTTDEDLQGIRGNLYNSVAAVMGVGEAIGPRSKKQALKGIMTQISGEEGPKGGMFHSKLLSRKQDMSGRGTIYAAPDVGFNEAKFPKDMLWTMFKMHILRELTKGGMNLIEAKKQYDNHGLAAQNAFQKLCKEIPVILNRPPTLMKTNVLAMYPIPIDGKTIGMNPLHLPGFGADYDGDALTVHVPVTPEAIREAKENLLPSRHLSDARISYGSPMFAPGHESILGANHLTKADLSKDIMHFKTEEEALTALKEGKISDNQPIKIG